jgi:hypothetical protein
MYGLFSSVIGGGAGAVSAAIGVNLMDADQSFSLQKHPLHLVELMTVCFIVNGFFSTFLYLSKSPLPQIETVIQSTNIQPEGKGVHIDTKTTTTQEKK